ncbi:hypothetical protein [Bacillus badius]|uniref:Uncharacterized protein n=1 Tax=Bacillus badius TaxID=1455 RepID=A0ABR5ARK7_BACBA|nr:hypothetical protein [Bacillus badius]KIL77391.1 hypothetical protein SD77_1377 [Bacillus badius]MED0666715.1 hypothetical protein [Bacillus badius]MED4717265.1 hypothetical protein [Bacillus badius]TDW01466.1 hypothetical protein B0G66_11188 [Bacillus badius]
MRYIWFFVILSTVSFFIFDNNVMKALKYAFLVLAIILLLDWLTNRRRKKD